LQVEGLTIEELRLFLTEQFRPYVLRPEVFITPIGYRPVRIYVGGEVARPGYYTIRGAALSQDLTISNQRFQISNSGAIRATGASSPTTSSQTSDISQARSSQQLTLPTLFDALQAARGVTPFSQLNTVQITRKRPLSQGGGKVRTNVNFLRLISDGDEDVNIRLYDGDAVFVRKSDDVLRDQLLAASRTNLSPDFVEVFVSGRVKEPGPQQLPQGASLNQAIASAGGPMLLRGRVEFLRFTQEGATDRRLFSYNPNATSGDYRNPVLIPGDVVRVNESLVSASLEFLNEITAPAVGLYSVYSIYRDFQQ
jgi:polysaccharide export outer membrane protein